MFRNSIWLICFVFLSFFEIFYCFSWRFQSLSPNRLLLHSTNGKPELEETTPFSSILKKRLKDTAEKLRKEADMEKLQLLASNGTDIHVRDDVKGFVVEKPLTVPTRDNYPYYANKIRKASESLSIDVDFGGEDVRRGLPSLKPVLRYLQVIREFDITAFDEDGLPNDDRNLWESDEVDSFKEVASMGFFIDFGKKNFPELNITASERNTELFLKSAVTLINVAARGSSADNNERGVLAIVKTLLKGKLGELFSYDRLKELYLTLLAYDQWRNHPKIKSLLRKGQQTYYNPTNSNALLANMYYPRSPIGIKTLITDRTIMSRNYWNHLLTHNLTMIFPMSAYLTMLSTAYATRSRSPSPSKPVSLTTTLMEQTILVLEKYLSFLQKYQVKTVDEEGLPDVSNSLNPTIWSLQSSMIQEMYTKLSSESNDVSLLQRVILLYVSQVGLLPRAIDTKDLQEVKEMYQLLQEFLSWQVSIKNAGGRIKVDSQTSNPETILNTTNDTTSSTTSPFALLYEKYYDAWMGVKAKQNSSLPNIESFLLPLFPQNKFYELLTLSSHAQSSQKEVISGGKDEDLLDQSFLKVVLPYLRLLQEYQLLPSEEQEEGEEEEYYENEEWFDESGMLDYDSFVFTWQEEEQESVQEVIMQKIQEHWQQKRKQFSESTSLPTTATSSHLSLQRQKQLYKMAWLIYYRSIYDQSALSLEMMVKSPEIIFQSKLKELNALLTNNNSMLDQELLEMKSMIPILPNPETMKEVLKGLTTSLTEKFPDITNDNILNEETDDVEERPLSTKEREQLEFYLNMITAVTKGQEKVESIYQTLQQYDHWQSSAQGQRLLTLAQQHIPAETSVSKQWKEILNSLEYFYQTELLTSYPLSVLYLLLINVYQVFGSTVTFSSVLSLLSRGKPQEAAVTRLLNRGRSTKKREFVDLRAVLKERDQQRGKEEEGILGLNAMSNVTLVNNLLNGKNQGMGLNESMRALLAEAIGNYKYVAEQFISTTFFFPQQEETIRRSIVSLFSGGLNATTTMPSTVDHNEKSTSPILETASSPPTEISKELATEIRSKILKDINLRAMRPYKGAYILQSEMTEDDGPSFARTIERRFQEYTNYSSLVDYVVLYDELLPSGFSMEDLAESSLDRPRPTLILHPKQWQTTLTRNLMNGKWVARIYAIAHFLITISFTVKCFAPSYTSEELLTPGFLQTIVPTQLFPMIGSSLFVSWLSTQIEGWMAKQRGLTLKSFYVPSFGDIFSFGAHNSLEQLPKNRRDLFDIFIAGVLSSLVVSFSMVTIGLSSMSSLTTDQLQSLPSIPWSLLQTNSFLARYLVEHFPQWFETIDLTQGSSLIHLPWLSIVGIAAFITNIFRLLPFDQASIGRKLTFAIFGSRGEAFIGSVFGIVKVILLLAIGFFSDGSTNALPKELLFQYLVLVSGLPENAAPLITKNDLIEIGEGRKLLYFFVMFFTIVCFLPNEWNFTSVQSSLLSIFPRAL